MMLRLSISAALGTASVGQAIAKEAEAGPLYKALGATDGLTIKSTLRSQLEAIDGQSRPAPRPADDFLWSLRTTLFAEI